MRKQFIFLLVLIFTFLAVSCKDEAKNEKAQKESLEVLAEKPNEIKAKKRELTPDEKEKATSVMSRLIIIPELKKFASYAVTANLTDKLSNDKGPFIVFAPSNNTIEGLSSEKKKFYSNQENLSQLEDLLKSHIVEGNLDKESLMQIIKKDGKAKLKTLAGTYLVVTEFEGKIVVSDEKGGKAVIEKSDIKASNGQVFITDAVLNLP